ncbi:MAG: oligosaccharide flippase family protein [Christensenellaceae bacterium]
MRLLDKIRKNDFWVSVTKLTAGQLIGQFITLIATIFLSRIYESSDYGTYGIIISTSTIIMSIISLALGSAVMVAKTDLDSKRVFTVTYTFQIVFLLFIAASMLALAPIKRFFETSISYSLSVLLMVIYIAVNTLYTMMRVYINRLKLNNVLFLNSLITAMCTVLISIPLGLLGFGFVGLLLASICSSLFSVIHMLRTSSPFIKSLHWTDVKQTFLDCKEFILFQYPSNIMASFATQIPNLTLFATFGSSALGTYTMCNKVFQMPMNLIVSPIQTIYFRTAAQMSDKKAELADFSFGLVKKFMLIAILPMMIIMVFGEAIFSFVLGSQWAESGKIAAYICPYFFFYFCNNCLTYSKVAIGAQKYNLLHTILYFVGIAGTLIFMQSIMIGSFQMIILFSSVGMFFHILDLFLTFVCMHKNAGKFVACSLVFNLICYAGMFGFRYLLGY